MEQRDPPIDNGMEVEENRVGDKTHSSISTKNQTNISNLLTQIAACSYDRAKEIADGELDSFKLLNAEKSCEGFHGIKPSQEISIQLSALKILAQICAHEKCYGNLAFLTGSKSIFKKENSLKTAYNCSYNELSKLSILSGHKNKETPTKSWGSPMHVHYDQYKNNESNKKDRRKDSDQVTSSSDNHIFGLQANTHSVINDLMCFVSIRIEMMEFYDRVCGLGENSLSIQGPQIMQVSVASSPSKSLADDDSKISSFKSTKTTYDLPYSNTNLSRKPSVNGSTLPDLCDYPIVLSSRWNLTNMKNKSAFMPYKTVILPMLDKIEAHYKVQLDASCLQNMANVIHWELGAIKGLLNGLQLLDELDFYGCLLNINKANSFLILWENFIKKNKEDALSNIEMKSSKTNSSISGGRSILENFWQRKTSTSTSSKSNFSSSNVKSVGSPLFRWIIKLKDSVLSKFTFLYFQELSCQVPSIESMLQCYDKNISKLENGIDFVRKTEAFQKKLFFKEKHVKLSSYFSLVCETSIKAIDKNAKGQQQLKTIDEMDKPSTFVHQSIFTSSFTDANLGIKREDASKENPAESTAVFEIQGNSINNFQTIHLPIISTHIQDEATWTHLSRPNQVVYFEALSCQFKYFLLRSEPQIVQAFIVYSNNDKKETSGMLKKPANQSVKISPVDEVSQFLNEMASDIRCNHTFSLLKTSTIYS